jgi:DnaJ-domain-containing protein 1
MTGDELIVIVICGLIGYGLVWFVLSLRNRYNAAEGESTAGTETKTPDPKQYQAPDWYQVLEVPQTATIDEISAAYRRKIMQYHPDRVETLGAEFKQLAETRTRELNRAYEIACETRR